MDRNFVGMNPFVGGDSGNVVSDGEDGQGSASTGNGPPGGPQ